MDFSTFSKSSAANEGAKLELRGPDGALILKGDNTPVTITLLGKDSDTFVKATNAVTNRILGQRGKAKLTAEGNKADEISTLAKCTVAWDGIGIGEDSTACTYENAVRLYTEHAFIREQVDEFIGERSNFLKG